MGSHTVKWVCMQTVKRNVNNQWTGTTFADYSKTLLQGTPKKGALYRGAPSNEGGVNFATFKMPQSCYFTTIFYPEKA